ncbi:MAG: energy transducer TonB [Bdellovibrionaceae bacterium]|nr:energy transducer TonB [Pseudobdellovibrionaceae bacterium]
MTRRKSFALGLILSFLLHALLLASVVIVPEPPDQETLNFGIIEVELPKKQSDEEQKPRQIVQQNTRPGQEKPDKADYLAEHNQKVEKQTVARHRGEFRNSQNLGGRPRLSASDLSPKFDGLAAMEKQQRNMESRSQQLRNAEVEPSATDDYLKNIAEGDQTALNTREFRYYTYYNRIRRQLSQHWEPTVREKLARMFRQGRSIASNSEHTTKLLIILDTQGRLVKVQVLSESGVHDLDEAAMEAFRSAAPFPHPPKGIVEQDGTVRIRWDFILES